MNVNERLCCILAWRLGGRFVFVLDSYIGTLFLSFYAITISTCS
jgi:hypothetical protein